MREAGENCELPLKWATTTSRAVLPTVFNTRQAAHLEKGNIVKEPLGKFEVTLLDTQTRRALRVTAKYER